MNDSCGVCSSCIQGIEISCETHRIYGFTSIDSGSFGENAVRSEAHLHTIPEGLSSAAAAPLMCGGITVWSALTVDGVRPNETIGVVGIGGLGHLAVQFAKAKGHEVVVFSSTNSKKDEAMKLGTTHFASTKDKTELSSPTKINHLLVTSSQSPDWNLFFPILASGASIYSMTVVDQQAKLDIPHMAFMINGMRIISAMPKKWFYQDMLNFAARNGIAPVVDRDEMTKDGFAKSMEKLRLGQTRYRGVLYAVGEQ